jgi:hypothetical protein
MSDIFVIFRSADAMLRGVKRLEVDPCGRHHVDIPAAVPCNARMIGDQPDSLAPQGGEILRRQHIDACEHLLRGRLCLRDHCRPGAGDRENLLRRVRQRKPRRGHARHLRTNRSDGRPKPGVDAVAQQNHISIRRRVDPQGSACKSGMAV